MGASPSAVEQAASELEAILDRDARVRCEAVLAAAAECEAVFARGASRIRAEARERLMLGYPPSLRRVVGLSSLEVPMNKTLGWILDPHERGDASRRGLAEIAKLLDYPVLLDDIQRGSPIVVITETSPDESITSRAPDLTISSPHATLLIENKVNAPQSGFDQYAHYLKTLIAWSGEREHRAYLLAPELRERPSGWSGSLTHAQVAEALRPLATDPTLSFWDRVVYALVVNDLDSDRTADRARQIERLLEEGNRLSEVAVATRLSQLLRHPTIDPTSGGI